VRRHLASAVFMIVGAVVVALFVPIVVFARLVAR
jgi:hypothetical protein